MFSENLVVKELLDIVSEGLIFIDSEGFIKIYNKKAKEIFGIIYNQGDGHPSGKLVTGDIVIITDTHLGIDDGGLKPNDLKKIGIESNKISHGDTFVCIGTYNGSSISFKKNNQAKNLLIEENIKNLKIKASIDHEKKETYIKINQLTFQMSFIKALGFIVVLDKQFNVKFYQAKGYTARNESIKDILSGEKYMAKGSHIKQINVLNRHIYDIHERTEGINDFYLAAKGKDIKYDNKCIEINGRPTLCTLESINSNNKRIGAVLKVKDISEIKKLIEERDRAIKKLNILEDQLNNREELEDYFPRIIGSSQKMYEVKHLAYKASKSDSNVLILGESGTGKSMIAEAIHNISNRSEKEFIHINCGSIPENLIESELFGYEKGAFTGAKNEGKIGYFEKANGGTLLLDEIGELPINVQPKLLKVLQDKKFYRVGGVKEIEVDLKIIAATNKDLEKEVKVGSFREDLFYRINVLPIFLPPLKKRREDIFDIINHLLPQICKRVGCEKKRLSIGAIQKLKKYDFPGNIRELENVLERAVNINEGRMIYSDDINIRNNDTKSKNQIKSLEEVKNEAEKKELIKAIEKFNGNKSKILESLGIGKSAFYNKLKKYEIDIP